MTADGLASSVADQKRVHETALRILSELGIWTDHDGMRKLLAERGCRLHNQRVLIPPQLVRRTISDIPSSFFLYGRSPSDRVLIGDPEHVWCTNTGMFTNIYDLDSGVIRSTTLADVQQVTRILDALDNLHLVYVSLVEATDLAPHLVRLGSFAATLANTTKPLIGPGLGNRAEAEAVVSMARALRNDDEAELRRYPVCTPSICPVSPLRFPRDIVEALIVIARSGLPLRIGTNPIMGISAPYTLAGTVALGHAEVLASMMMAQTVCPGLPMLVQNSPSVADMRTLASTTGGPETGLMRRLAVELCHYLNLPGIAHGHTSSTRLDHQAADEKALNALLIASARPAVLGGCGGLANVTLTSYESILLDDERFGAILRILDGITADDDHLAFEVIAHLTAGRMALTEDHTLRHLRSGEVWEPRLARRAGLALGRPAPQISLDRAHAEVVRILTTHQVQPLPTGVEEQIRKILRAHDVACSRDEVASPS